MFVLRACVVAAALALSASAVSIHEINGKHFVSEYAGKNVSDVTGIVTAKGTKGIYLRSVDRSNDKRVSNGLFVSNPSLGKNDSINVGNTVTVSGEMWYNSPQGYAIYTPTLKSAKVDKLEKTSHKTKPLVIGKDTVQPPTKQFSSLDKGNVFGVPNNQSTINKENPELNPTKYGLDFWRSIEGELVKIESPITISKSNQYGDVWVRGNWNSSSINNRGGLTVTDKDGNPEAIQLGDILDGSKGEQYRIGEKFEDIVGVVNYVHGAYFVHPLEKPVKKGEPSPDLPDAVPFKSSKHCSGITVSDYNIENFSPKNTDRRPKLAEHIVHKLNSPDLLFLQEVQDNNGPKNDDVVDANKTLSFLADAISSAGGPKYSFVDVNPVDDKDGGQPGSNIRQAYMYNPKVLRLAPGKVGGTNDTNEVVEGPALKYKVGRVHPDSDAFDTSRKPLAAQWETVEGNHTLFTVNVHYTSKGGSTPLTGNARPPINKGIDKRTEQAKIAAKFIADILAKDKNASVVFGGDANEFPVAEPLLQFANTSGLHLVDDAAGIEKKERYTYTFQNNMQQIDVLFVSPAIARKSPKAEHVHVNTWVKFDDQVSDHDPTVAKINICKD